MPGLVEICPIKGSGEEVENVKSLQSDRRMTSNNKSSRAFRSGELIIPLLSISHKSIFLFKKCLITEYGIVGLFILEKKIMNLYFSSIISPRRRAYGPSLELSVV